MRFKVGDKVRVREDINTENEKYTFVEGMKEYKGKEFIIHEVWRNCYRLKDIGYYWTDEMLELVEEGKKNNMNIEELNLEYKTKMDALMEEYKTKAKEITEAEEPFIKEGQEYFTIDTCFKIKTYDYNDDAFDRRLLESCNIFPYTEENEEEVRKEVKLTAERRKLQSQMEMFARQNNEGEIDWNDRGKGKYYLFIDHRRNDIKKAWTFGDRHLNTTYFTSKEVAQKALEKFGDRIKELYIDIEEQ